MSITSAEENYFLTHDPDLGNGESANLIDGHWTGGYQKPGFGEPAGGWTWVTGEAFSLVRELVEYHVGGRASLTTLVAMKTTLSLPMDLSLVAAKLGMMQMARALQVILSEYEVAPVPEPSTYMAGLSALGLLGLFGWRNRK